MNKTKYLALAFAALTLGACTNDDVVVQDDPNVAQEGETSYVSLAINLPTQPSTRVGDGESVNLDDGTPEEYEVKNGVLALFKGKTEADATFASAYKLDVTGFKTQSPDDDQITSQAILVQEVAKPSTAGDENIYALVMLNTNNVVTVDGTSLKIGTETFSGDFEDLTKKDVTVTGNLTGSGFFMSNAPLYNKVGGVTKPEDGGVASTLSVMAKNKFYTTQNAASSDPAATIYVERAMAKVTVAAEDAESLNDGNSNIASYDIVGWTLDVTNNKAFLVRNVAGNPAWWQYANEDAKATDKYRFVGSTAVATGLYRTYWGIDPNYTGDVKTSDFTTANGQIADNALKDADGETPLYCLENTFDTQNMNNDQTTRVILKAKLNLDGGKADTDGSFYTINDNTSTVYKADGIKDFIKAEVLKWIETNKNIYFTAGTINGTDLTVTLPTTGDGGYIDMSKVSAVVNTSISGITWAKGQNVTNLNTAIASSLKTILENYKIGYYKGGYSYYEVRIKHFGDTQTPWTSAGEDGSYSGTNAENNWLGRWGVLRNNWYDLTITVKNIGSPEVPEVTNKPDDPEKSYVAVTINILSWAKRTQSVEL